MSSGLGGLGLHHPSRPHFPPPGPEFTNASKPRAGGASPKWVIFCSSALPAGCEGQDGPIRPPGGGDEGWGRRQKGGRGKKSVGPRCGAHSVIRNAHPGSFTTTLVRWYRAEAPTWDRGSIRLERDRKPPETDLPLRPSRGRRQSWHGMVRETLRGRAKEVGRWAPLRLRGGVQEAGLGRSRLRLR